jgi:hypothetical protein
MEEGGGGRGKGRVGARKSWRVMIENKCCWINEIWQHGWNICNEVYQIHEIYFLDEISPCE